MGSLPLIEQSAEERSPTKVVRNGLGGEDANTPGRLDGNRPAASKRNEQLLDTYPPVKVGTLSRLPCRRRHGGTGTGRPNLLVRGLAATRQFFFDEDKTLHEGYVPNYRCISSLSPQRLTPLPDPRLTLFVRYLPILSGLIVPFAILLEGILQNLFLSLQLIQTPVFSSWSDRPLVYSDLRKRDRRVPGKPTNSRRSYGNIDCFRRHREYL